MSGVHAQGRQRYRAAGAVADEEAASLDPAGLRSEKKIALPLRN
jgi:hypothetical protein